MPRFRKKQFEVEAVQWDGSRASIDKICRWARERFGESHEDPIVSYVFQGADDVRDPMVWTPTGNARFEPGDFIVLDPSCGSLPIPLTPEVFEATYEPADRDQQGSPATVGLSPELAQALSDPTIIVDRDREITLKDGRTLAEHLEEWSDAPSDTVSALSAAEQKAFVAGYRAGQSALQPRDQQGDTGEVERRLAYLLAGWQESYRSAQYWRQRARRADQFDALARERNAELEAANEDGVDEVLKLRKELEDVGSGGSLDLTAPTQQQPATEEDYVGDEAMHAVANSVARSKAEGCSDWATACGVISALRRSGVSVQPAVTEGPVTRISTYCSRGTIDGHEECVDQSCDCRCHWDALTEDEIVESGLLIAKDEILDACKQGRHAECMAEPGCDCRCHKTLFYWSAATTATTASMP